MYFHKTNTYLINSIMKDFKHLILIFIVSLFFMWQCKNSSNTQHDVRSTLNSVNTTILPDPKIPGFNFPENRNTIEQWINEVDTVSINRHAWGIWTALTMSSGQKDHDSIPVLAYQTWKTPADLMQKKLTIEMQIPGAKEMRGLLEIPNQLGHGGKRFGLAQRLKNRKNFKLATGLQQNDTTMNEIMVTENYNSSCSAHIDSFKLFSKISLENMEKEKQKDIPEFPNSSISIKPTYKILAHEDYVNGLCAMNAWNGPSTDSTGFSEEKWKSKIYIDTTNQYGSNQNYSKSAKPTANKIYNLKDFIYYRLSSTQANTINTSVSNGYYRKVKARDFVILVGMHVTTKETVRWTWQTFWWSPDPEKPRSPSSVYTASYRPSQLKNAPRHYALSSAYTFIFPNQPLTGGNNIGTSVIAYNPYLESSFAFLGDSALRYKAYVVTKGIKIANNIGDRSNCMSCHAMSNYNQDQNSKIKYLGDTYIDKNDVRLKGFIKTDFLWSIADRAK